MPDYPHDFDPATAFPRPRKDIDYSYDGNELVALPRGMTPHVLENLNQDELWTIIEGHFRQTRNPHPMFPRKPAPQRTMSIAYCIGNDVDIEAICDHCDRRAKLDLRLLIERKGPEFRPGDDLEGFGKSLRCRAEAGGCGLQGAKVEFNRPHGPGWDGRGAHFGNSSK